MATIPANQLIHAEITMSALASATGASTKNVVAVFHYRRIATAVDPDKAALDVIFQSSIVVPLFAMLNQSVTQIQNQIRFLNDATDSNQAFTHAVVGGITTTASQKFDSVTFQFKTPYRGKSGRGGKHFGPLSEADANGDVLVNPALANWIAFKATLLAPLTDTTTNVWNPCVVSKGADPPKSQLKTNPTTVFSNDVIQVVLNKTLGTMRRRKPRTITA